MVFLFFYLYGVSGIVQRIVPAPGDKISSDSISMALSYLKPAYVANLVSPANLRQSGSFAKLFFVVFAAFTEKKTREIQEFSQKIQQGNLNVHAGATLFRGQRIQPYCSTSASSYRKRLIDFLGVFSNSSL